MNRSGRRKRRSSSKPETNKEIVEHLLRHGKTTGYQKQFVHNGRRRRPRRG